MEIVMSELLLKSLGCPSCGAPYELGARDCKYCQCSLLVVSVAGTFSRNLDEVQLSQSIKKWRDELKNDPESGEAHYAIGISYLNNKLRDPAVKHLRKAADLIPEIADVHYNLAITLFDDGNFKLESQDHQDIIKEIGLAVRMAPDFKEAKAFQHYILARKLDHTNRREAVEEYKKAIDACGDIATFHNNLAFAYHMIGDYENAEPAYLEAINVDSEYMLAYSNLAWLCFDTKKYEEGVVWGEKAVELINPTMLISYQSNAYNNYAINLNKCGRKEEAISAINKAIALNPKNQVARNNLEDFKRIQRRRRKFPFF